MKCHFVWDEQLKEKVLIPYCYASLHRNDKECCTCYDYSESAKEFEKDHYNKTVKELREEVEYYRIELQKAVKIIESLNKQAYQLQ